MNVLDNIKKKIATNRMAYQKQMNVLAVNRESCVGMPSCEQILSQSFYDLPVSDLFADEKGNKTVLIESPAIPSQKFRGVFAVSMILLAACLTIILGARGNGEQHHKNQLASSAHPIVLIDKGIA